MFSRKKAAFLFWMLIAGFSYSSVDWYQDNMALKAVFHPQVWQYIQRAGQQDLAGNRETADEYLRIAGELIEKAKPFFPDNWPKDWPDDGDALKLLRYASPEAYFKRILGDYAFFHNRRREALMNYKAYINLSIILDNSYMMKKAEIFESDDRWTDAKIVYEEMYKAIAANNFHGRAYSPAYLRNRIKRTELRLKKPNILALDLVFRNIQDFIRADVQKMFTDELNNMEGVTPIERRHYERIMSEHSIGTEDFKHNDRLSFMGKMVNADYVLRPSLTMIGRYFILNVDVFDPQKEIWFESYEFKTESWEYIHNYIKRFAYRFQDKDIPANLYIPEDELLWNFEADSLISDLKFSFESQNIIAGTENGSVYILNSEGEIISQFDMPERIIRVGISPCGSYFSWITLEGKLYFADLSGRIMWTRETDNYARGVDISRNGRFMVYAINDTVFFKDKNGQLFWKASIPQWASFVKISEDSRQVFVGMEGGQYWSFSDEGNVLWRKNLNRRVEKIKVSQNNYNVAVNSAGRTFLFDSQGGDIMDFEAGQDIQYAVFNTELLSLLSGQKGEYFYLFSMDRQSLWRYNLTRKASFVSNVEDGTFLTTVEGRNIFSFRINWK